MASELRQRNKPNKSKPKVKSDTAKSAPTKRQPLVFRLIGGVIEHGTTILQALVIICLCGFLTNRASLLLFGPKHKLGAIVPVSYGNDQQRDVNVWCVGADTEATKRFLLLHGEADTMLSFSPIMLKLASQYQACTYDRQGRGLSSGVLGAELPANATAELAAVVKSMTPKKLILVGHGLGALLAINYARENADKIHALVLLDPLYTNSWNSTEGRAFRSSLTRQFGLLEPAAISGALRVAAISRPDAFLYDRLPEEMHDYWTQILNAAITWRTFTRDIDSLTDWETTLNAAVDELGADEALLDLPVLVLFADNRRATPLVDAEQLTALQAIQARNERVLTKTQLSSVRVQWLDVTDTGHHVHWDAPDDVVSAIRDFGA